MKVTRDAPPPGAVVQLTYEEAQMFIRIAGVIGGPSYGTGQLHMMFGSDDRACEVRDKLREIGHAISVAGVRE